VTPAADDGGVHGVQPIQYTLTGSAGTAEAVAMLEDWISQTGCVPRTLHLDGAKELVGSEMRDFCRKHNITLQLVPAYNHLLQWQLEGVIRLTKLNTRVAA